MRYYPCLSDLYTYFRSKHHSGLMKMFLFNCAVVVISEACCFVFVCAYALYESFLFADDFKHESLLSLQFFVVSGEEAIEVSEVTMDFEVKLDACVRLVSFMAEDFEVVLVLSGVEEVCVLNNVLNSGHERRYESFCRLLRMGGGGRVGGEGGLSLLFEK